MEPIDLPFVTEELVIEFKFQPEPAEGGFMVGSTLIPQEFLDGKHPRTNSVALRFRPGGDVSPLSTISSEGAKDVFCLEVVWGDTLEVCTIPLSEIAKVKIRSALTFRS